MADPYATVFRSTLQSTVWQRPDPIRLVWLTMLMLADSEGNVFASIPGLAHTARVSVADCETAIREFQQSDHYSRDSSNDGRRIEEIDGGYLLLNYKKWCARARSKARREQNAEHQRNKRKSLKDKECQQPSATISPEAEAEADTEANPSEDKNPLRERPARKKNQLPAGFDLTPMRAKEALSRDLDPKQEMQAFRDWAQAKGTTYKDWEAAWRNWCNKSAEFKRGRK